MKTFSSILTGLVILALTITADGGEIRIQSGGATFPDPIYKLWIQQYHTMHPDVTIDYQAQGSGFGIKNITNNAVEFAGSDAPMNKEELAAAGGAASLIEIPTVAGAVVVAYNLPGLKDELKLDGPTLSEIYLGTIKKWNDPKIAALNAGVALPDMAISTVHRADASGTTFIFTRYLSGQSQDFNKNIGSAKDVKWPGGAGAPGNAGVSQLIQQTPGTVGYLELAFAVANKIPTALMKNKEGKFIKAAPEAVSLAGESAAASLKGDILVANIWNQPGEKSYPISSFTYIIIRKDLSVFKDPAKAKAVADFLRWAVTDGQKLASDLNYAPLSESVRKKVTEALTHLTVDGKPVP